MEDLFESYLESHAKEAITALKTYRENKRRLFEDGGDPEPHHEDEERPEPKAKKAKPQKAAVDGPCEGRIWLDPASSCPGAEAGRGKNPERDANTFARAVYDKKRHVFCVSCKREYSKFRKDTNTE